jgi:hypothetical protein
MGLPMAVGGDLRGLRSDRRGGWGRAILGVGLELAAAAAVIVTAAMAV